MIFPHFAPTARSASRGEWPRACRVVVRPSPLARAQRAEGPLLDHVPRPLVAGEAEVDDLLRAARHRHEPASGLRWPVLKRLPPRRRVPAPGPERRRGDPGSPIGSVRIHGVVGRAAKTSSTACRYSPTTAPRPQLGHRVGLNRAWARTTGAGTGRGGHCRTAQSSWVRIPLIVIGQIAPS
jgi:hypothetical protein